MKRLLYTTCAAICVGIAIGGAVRADVVLRAATATVNGKPEVRLRWSLTNGWLPDGGFNLYRIDGGKRGPAIHIAPAGVKPAPQKLDLATALKTAHTLPANVAEKDIKLIEPPNTKPILRTADLFQKLHATRQQMFSPLAPNTTIQSLALRAARPTELKAYFARLAQPQGQTLKAVPDQRAMLIQTRKRLLMAAFMRPEVADSLGLAYNDPNVTQGATIQYAIRRIDGGKESAADDATVSITVGADPQPPAPTGLQAMMYDTYVIDLRWDHLTADQVQTFGSAHYDIYRADPHFPQSMPDGIKVNRNPVIHALIQTADGAFAEPLYDFRDHAEPGPVTYKVTMTDMFGRVSPPATLAFTVEDWKMPRPVNLAQAQHLPIRVLNRATTDAERNRVSIVWRPVGSMGKNEDNASFNIYRVDAEQPNAALQKMNPTPIPGNPLPLSQISIRRMMDLDPAFAKWIKEVLANKYENPNLPLETDVDTYLTKLEANPGTKPMAQLYHKTSLLSFDDLTGQPDHYYRYYVASVFTKNNRDATPLMTNNAGVPLTTLPAAPTNLRSTWKATAPKATPTPLGMPTAEEGGTQITQGAAKLNGNAPTINKGLRITQPRISKIKGHFPDIGGTVTLQWDPTPGLTKPVTYHIYRANATGYFPPSPGGPNPAPSPELGAAMTPARGKSVTLKSKVTLQHYKGIETGFLVPKGNYALLGQVVDNGKTGVSFTFADSITRSHANYYLYRVAAVNRWGVEGPAIQVPVRVPATMPPSVPALVNLYPNPTPNTQGLLVPDIGTLEVSPVTLTVTPNQEQEEVIAYHVMRQIVQPALTLTPSPLAAALPDGAAVQKKQASVQFGGKSLVGDGPIAKRNGAGAARFGIVRRQSIASQFSRAVADGTIAQSAAFKSLFDPTAYKEVAVIQADPASFVQTGYVTINPANQQRGALVAVKPDPQTGAMFAADTHPEAAQEYVYRIVAENSDHLLSAPSALMDATPYRIRANPPGAITTQQAGKGVKLSWGPATGAVGYIVNRGAGANGPFVQLTGILTGTTNFTDFSARAGTSYVYQVLAIDASGNVSNPVSKSYP